MTSLTTVLGITVVAHVVLAAGVSYHSRRADTDPSYWLPATLLFGVVGVAGYLWSR